MSLAADSSANSLSSEDVNSLSSEDLTSFLEELEQGFQEESTCEDDDLGGNDDIEQDRVKRQKVVEWELGDKSVETAISPDSAASTSNTAISQLDSAASTSNKPCSHPGFFRDMFMLCGQVVEASGVALGYIHKHMRFDSQEIARIKHADLERKLKRDRKLYLVLDLDHTLLNSTTLSDVAPYEDHLKQGDLKAGLYRLDKIHMLTKLRPFVHTFLKKAYDLYEMHVYTMAEQSYALEMAKILDPNGMYFRDRIISQSDSTKRNQKGLDVVVGAESAVLILDDTIGVWQRHKDNLILMERYHYFGSSSGQFDLNSKSLSERMVDESETDGALSTVFKIIEQVHQEFFHNLDSGADIKDVDVRPVVKRIRQNILKDCKLVFSHLFPINSLPNRQPLWRMAVELGAVCSVDLDSSVTHVVAGNTGTEKAKWAVREKKFLISPHWIEAANYLWRRPPEMDFAVSQTKG